jgi:hypothetical protein
MADKRNYNGPSAAGTLITLLIIVMFIFSGPASAVTVAISGLSGSITKGDSKTFSIQINLETPDKYVPISNITLSLSGPTSTQWTFNPFNGSIISGNSDISIDAISSPNSSYYGYGNGYGIDTVNSGYGYDFGPVYGYGYNFGQGGKNVSFTYLITLSTTNLAAGNYTTYAYLNTGKSVKTSFASSSASFTIATASSGGGVIMNPGFESGTASWLFYTNGKGTFTATSPGYEGTKAARVALNSDGTNIQLYQAGISLEPDTRYRLSFSAYSTNGHDIIVNLIEHGSPYTKYGLEYTANLGTSWQTFSTEFTTQGFTGTVNDGRLMFWLAPFAGAGDIYFIDDVKLEKVRVDLIKNPGFESGTASWLFYTNGKGTFTATSPGYEGIKAAKIALKKKNIGTNIQLYQAGISLEPDTRYRLSFSAYSTNGHDITVNLIEHGSPYTKYGLEYTADLGTSWQTFSTEFTTQGFTEAVNDGRLMFWLAPFAGAGDLYYIDDVRLEMI